MTASSPVKGFLTEARIAYLRACTCRPECCKFFGIAENWPTLKAEPVFTRPYNKDRAMYKRILVAIDGSETGARALEEAVRLTADG